MTLVNNTGAGSRGRVDLTGNGRNESRGHWFQVHLLDHNASLIPVTVQVQEHNQILVTSWILQRKEEKKSIKPQLHMDVDGATLGRARTLDTGSRGSQPVEMLVSWSAHKTACRADYTETYM